jgi:hypothetical protein
VPGDTGDKGGGIRGSERNQLYFFEIAAETARCEVGRRGVQNVEKLPQGAPRSAACCSSFVITTDSS